MISKYLPGLSALYDNLISQSDPVITTLLFMGGLVMIALAVFGPKQLKPLALAWVVFP